MWEIALFNVVYESARVLLEDFTKSVTKYVHFAWAQKIFFNSNSPCSAFNASTTYFEWILNNMVWDIALFNAVYESAGVLFENLTK